MRLALLQRRRYPIGVKIPVLLPLLHAFALLFVCVCVFYSGFVYQFIRIVLAAMVAGCWASSKSEPIIKFFIFVELSASNMLAVTNLAICINLALVVKVKFPCCGTSVHSLKHNTVPRSVCRVRPRNGDSMSFFPIEAGLPFLPPLFSCPSLNLSGLFFTVRKLIKQYEDVFVTTTPSVLPVIFYLGRF